jgi:pimeloyl-ACP methyl ester carboxylesterase
MFIHGNGANLTQWGGQIAHFRDTNRVVAFDLRGMGASDVPSDGIYTMDAMVEDIHTVANALNLNRFIVVGHSYGGSVAAAYAGVHPERVAGVVYADAAGAIKAPREAWNRYLDALRMDKPGVTRQAFEPLLATATPEVKAAVLQSVDRTFVETFVEAMEGMRDHDIATSVARYKGPTLAIASTDSPSSFHVQFPHVRTRRINGAGHWLMMEAPAEFNTILEEFVKSIASSASSASSAPLR